MSQVILNVSGHHQALNAYHIHPHKWPENLPSAADQIRSAADRKPSAQPQTLNVVQSQPLLSLG
jgi:hypothetical protein